MQQNTLAGVTAILADAIEETAREMGDFGAPSGIIYAGLMSLGLTLDTYQGILQAMVAAGRITIDADCIKATS